MLAARYLLVDYQGPFRGWLAILLGMVLVSPYVALTIFFPIVIELSSDSDFLIYEIRNPDYMDDFLRLNYTAAKRANP
jgi:hypothetical protein